MIRDIRIAVDFLGHPKRVKLSKLLDVDDAAGLLLNLWTRTAMSKPDGVLRGLDDMDIAIMAGWAKDPEFFRESLHASGFLDRLQDGTWCLHDWAENQPWVIGQAARSMSAKKAALARHHGQEKEPEQEAATRATGPGQAGPVSLKMPEVGPKSAETMPEACAAHAERTQTAMRVDENRNAPLLSSSSPKGIKAPPERAIALSTPQGGERQPVKRFVPPTVLEIARYCVERANGIDAEAVYDHYKANGWKVGKNPMRDWRAAVRTWEAKRRQEQRVQASPQSPAARLLAKSQGGAGS